MENAAEIAGPHLDTRPEGSAPPEADRDDRADPSLPACPRHLRYRTRLPGAGAPVIRMVLSGALSASARQLISAH